MVLWRAQDLLELIPNKDVLYIIGDWNAKVGRQEIPAVTGKFGLEVQNEAGQRLIEFCQENALVIANTLFQQHKRRLYTWTSPDGQYWNQRLMIFFAAKWKVVADPGKTPGYLASWREEFNLGPETRLDQSELLCYRVLLIIKGIEKASDIDIRREQKDNFLASVKKGVIYF